MRNSCCSVVVGGGSGLGPAARDAVFRALGFAPEGGGFAPEEALLRGLLEGFFFCAIAFRLNASPADHLPRGWSQAQPAKAISSVRRVACAPSRATSTAGFAQCAGLGAS